MYDMVDFSTACNYPLKVVYFALEDPEIPVGKKILSHYLYTRKGISISSRELNSKERPLDNSIIAKIKEDEAFWRNFYNIVWIVNNAYTPNEIDNVVSKVYEKYGKTHHIVVIVDNQSNIIADPQDKDEWSAIKRFSREVARKKFCDFLGMTVITVLQLDGDTEKNAFRSAGKGSLVNIEPNLASIGDAKVVSKNMHHIFGIFDPWKYEIKEYPFAGGYQTEILRGRFRSLIHLKTNSNEMAPRFGMEFDGKHEIFREMPLVTDKEALDKFYREILIQQNEKYERKKTLFN